MNGYDKNGEDLKRLAEEIRKLGTPYDAPEPDSRYWANFRVRVMDRIEARENRGFRAFFVELKDWVTGHLLETGLAGVAAVLIALSITMNVPSPDIQPAGSVAQDAPQEQMPIASPSVTVTAPELAATLPAKHAGSPVMRQDRRMASRRSETKAKEFKEMAYMDEQVAWATMVAQPALLNSESDYPVSLDELSAPELESILKSISESSK